jgi:CheY-like chemotaxis protein
LAIPEAKGNSMTLAKTILVVDDDHDLREGLKTMLQSQGFRTLEADDGAVAQQMIDRHRPDLVLLDMMMPRWGGLAVLEHYQGKAESPRFIMMTATEGAKHQAYARQIGAAEYLRKPFPMEQLLAGVARTLHDEPVAEPTAALQTTEKVATEKSNPDVVRCRCRGCGARIKAPRPMLGQKRPCPGCQRTVSIFPESPEDEGPKLVLDDSAWSSPVVRKTW